jgi:peptidoglycan hydrolase CwlO-like protein
VVAISLLTGAPVFAAPLTGVEVPTEPESVEPPADTATPAEAPTKPAKKPASADTDAPKRRAPSTDSAIDVDVDEKTKKFRTELAERQKRLDEFIAQLDALDRELEVATEEYNAAAERLAQVKANIETAKGDLEKAQTAYEIQSGILGDRATSIYKDGSFAAVEILLGADSVSDLIARLKFLNTIGMRDADIAASLKGQEGLLDQHVSDLESSETAAEALEFELKARQIEILLRIQERQEMLSATQQDMLMLLDEEAARRRSEERTLLLEILTGASEKGIVATPGSPVETALAYHGVPYLWGGETVRGFDCSGLVLYVFRQHGVVLPHYSGSQFGLGEKVEISGLLPGDAVFFGSPIHHVGLYMGGGYYIHAPRTGDFVKISRLADRGDYAGARRYAWQPRVGAPTNAVSSTSEVLGATGTRP